MPLRDHRKSRNFIAWESFHDNWVVKMVDRLNESILSSRYTSVSGSHHGIEVESDVAALKLDESGSLFGGVNGNGAGGVATASPVYAPPAPTLSAEVSFTDQGVFEVKVYLGGSDWRLVAAIEVVSVGNKDHKDDRRKFTIKCASYLQSGIALVVVDAVPDHLTDLHLELCSLIDLPTDLRWKSSTGLSAISYRAVQGRVKPDLATGNDRVRLDVWPHVLAIGSELPTVPLWLTDNLVVPLELELTYMAACKSLRLG